MNDTINDILRDFRLGKLDLTAANAALKAAGANFHLSEGADGRWSEQEMAEGFRPGAPADPKPEKPDMSRRKELAGMTVEQDTAHGVYRVTYDDLGYAKSAVKE